MERRGKAKKKVDNKGKEKKTASRAAMVIK
jgi:hypothetical protein